MKNLIKTLVLVTVTVTLCSIQAVVPRFKGMAEVELKKLSPLVEQFEAADPLNSHERFLAVGDAVTNLSKLPAINIGPDAQKKIDALLKRISEKVHTTGLALIDLAIKNPENFDLYNKEIKKFDTIFNSTEWGKKIISYATQDQINEGRKALKSLNIFLEKLKRKEEPIEVKLEKGETLDEGTGTVRIMGTIVVDKSVQNIKSKNEEAQKKLIEQIKSVHDTLAKAENPNTNQLKNKQALEEIIKQLELEGVIEGVDPEEMKKFFEKKQ